MSWAGLMMMVDGGPQGGSGIADLVLFGVWTFCLERYIACVRQAWLCESCSHQPKQSWACNLQTNNIEESIRQHRPLVEQTR